VSIRWSKCTNHPPDGVSPAPGTSHGFIIRAFANGVSLEELLGVLKAAPPSARSHGFGGGGVDMLSVLPLLHAKRPARRNSTNSFSLCDDVRVYVPRVSDTFHGKKERKTLFPVDGRKHPLLRAREREREREKACKILARKKWSKIEPFPQREKARSKFER
jgi:hypothetical protein